MPNFSYKISTINSNGKISWGHSKKNKTGKLVRQKVTHQLSEVKRIKSEIDSGKAMVVEINKYVNPQLSMFSKQNFMVNYICRCSYLQLDNVETDIMLLFWNEVKEENLAKERNITAQRLEVIIKSIFYKLGVNSLFQANFIIENF